MKQTIIDTWGEFWNARTQREKTILMWGGLVVAIAIVYLVLWAPAYEGRARLRSALPGMRCRGKVRPGHELAPAARLRPPGLQRPRHQSRRHTGTQLRDQSQADRLRPSRRILMGTAH